MNKGTARHRRKKAFTLVELLVASAVIAVGMVYVLGALGRCMTALAASERMVTASFLLNNKLWQLDELYRQDQGAEMGTDRGRFDEPYDLFEWEQFTTAVSAEVGDGYNQTTLLRDAFLEETVRVSWSTQGQAARSISVTRYVPRRQLEV